MYSDNNMFPLATYSDVVDSEQPVHLLSLYFLQEIITYLVTVVVYCCGFRRYICYCYCLFQIHVNTVC